MPKRRTIDPLAALNRRSLLAGLAAGAALPAGAVLATPDRRLADSGRLEAWLKLRADLTGAPVWFSAEGEGWSWVPGEESRLLFRTHTALVSRVERTTAGWRLDQHELTWFLDPESGAPLGDWENPLTGERVRAVHRFRRLPSELFATVERVPTPVMHGRELLFRSTVFASAPSALERASFPRHSAGPLAQSGRFDAVAGHRDEVLDPVVTSAACVGSRSELTQWLPFMEMGNRPGALMLQSWLHKTDGPGELPGLLLGHARTNHPELFDRPVNSVAGFDAEVAALLEDAKRA